MSVAFDFPLANGHIQHLYDSVTTINDILLWSTCMMVYLSSFSVFVCVDQLNYTFSYMLHASRVVPRFKSIWCCFFNSHAIRRTVPVFVWHLWLFFFLTKQVYSTGLAEFTWATCIFHSHAVKNFLLLFDRSGIVSFLTKQGYWFSRIYVSEVYSRFCVCVCACASDLHKIKLTQALVMSVFLNAWLT